MYSIRVKVPHRCRVLSKVWNRSPDTLIVMISAPFSSEASVPRWGEVWKWRCANNFETLVFYQITEAFLKVNQSVITLYYAADTSHLSTFTGRAHNVLRVKRISFEYFQIKNYTKNTLRIAPLNSIHPSLPNDRDDYSSTNPARNPSLTIMTRIESARDLPFTFTSLFFRKKPSAFARKRWWPWSLIFDLPYSPSSTQWILVAAAFRWAHRPSRALLWN